MTHFTEIISRINAMVWGPGTQFLLVGTGAFLTLRTRFLPWRHLGRAMKSIFSPAARAETGGDVSPLASLMTALAVPRWGRALDQFGARNVLLVGCIGEQNLDYIRKMNPGPL